MKKDVIIFDCQVFQSTAWDRGMGKYSLNLLAALQNNDLYKYKKTYLLFSNAMNLAPEAEADIKKACPEGEFIFIDLKAPKVQPGEDIRPIQKANKKILDEFISTLSESEPDYVILSLLIDQYVSAFPNNSKNILLFYDLIPLQYSERYGSMWSYPNYLRRFKTIFEADVILTISQTVADDLVVYTGIDSEKIQNINGAPIDRRGLKSTKPKIKQLDKFVLMPSGNDLRKNNFRAVQGFEEFRLSSGNEDYKLIITSHFDEKSQKQLEKFSGSLIFTGNVSEAELKWLYQNTEALLFVSEYEGLGLPVLEAVEEDKPVACSNIRVFNEMSDKAFYYADEHNPSSIANALIMATNKTNYSKKRKEYPAINQRYTWDNTASGAMAFISSSRSQPKKGNDKPKIAVFAPTPNGYSAIGKVVMLSHPSLTDYFDVDYYLEEGQTGNQFSRQSYLAEVAKVFKASEFSAKNYADYDAVIYHIGNSEYHLESIKNALHLPGYLIVHDTRLNDVFEDVLVRYAYMDSGRLLAERKLNQMSATAKTTHMTSLINASLGVVTHSKYAKKAIKKDTHNNQPVVQLNLPSGTPEVHKLKIGSRFNLGFAGIIHKAKGINLVDQIISSPDFHDVDLYIFGVPLMEPGELERLEAYPNVKIEKNLTDFQFESRLSEMDAIVSYRPNYNGETSLTVLEAMRHGVVPIVRRIGWFDELPDEAVEKTDSEEGVLNSIRKLLSDYKYLDNKRNVAKAYMAENYSYTQYAEGLYELISAELRKEPQSLNSRVADALKRGQKKDSIKRLYLS